MERHAVVRGEERGAAFFVVVLLSVAATVLIGAFFSTSLGKVRHVEQQVAENAAFNAAESGMNALIEQVWTLYKTSPPATRVAALDPIDGKLKASDQFRIVNQPLGRSTFTAEVREVRAVGIDYADVEFVSTGRNARASRSLMAVVRFGREPSRVFDHAYFINNFGWLWGSGITVNGSVRSNGNFSLSNATVNGDIHAAENPEIGAAGTIEGNSYHDTIPDYNAAGETRARPSNPSAPSEDANGNGVLDPGEDLNGNGFLDVYDYKDGYEGTSERHDGQKVIEMPYLGDLQTYRNLADTKNGALSHGGVVVVDGTFGDDVAEEQNLMLIGTPDDPIVVDGPVVIEGDVVLKGVITGRGTIYAGRNVHIIGNLEYLNPPEWPKPMTDKAAIKAQNAGRDLVGLAAKGSIIMGDYTESGWKSGVSNYQKPPFTSGYRVHATDADNGYVTGTDSQGYPWFNGDYTAYDGGEKMSDDGVNTESRRFFESSFSDAEIHAAADEDYVTRIDAVLYTNHLLSGRVGACTWNGTLVSRDEAILYSGTADMNYDVRVKGDGYENIDIFLPRGPAYRLLYWSEGLEEETTTTTP